MDMNLDDDFAKKLFFLIDKIKKGEISELYPHPNISSQFGFSITPANSILEFTKGEEIFYLDKLAENNILSRQVSENISVCPFCHGYLLAHRKTCPVCHNSDLSVKDLVHHYKCGEVNEESAFETDDGFICPKCHKKLGHIGIDYEIPGQIYTCNNCNEKFESPLEEHKCLSCLHTFSPGSAQTKKIYSYTAGSEIMSITDVVSLMSVFIKQKQDADPISGFQSIKTFANKISEELHRSKRYKSDVSFLVIDFEGTSSELFVEQFDKNYFIKHVSNIFRENTRDVDVMTRYKDSFYLMLPETDSSGRLIVTSKLERVINEFLKKEKLSHIITFKIKETTFAEIDELLSSTA
jgi:GGDEF domain-containing protein